MSAAKASAELFAALNERQQLGMVSELSAARCTRMIFSEYLRVQACELLAGEVVETGAQTTDSQISNEAMTATANATSKDQDTAGRTALGHGLDMELDDTSTTICDDTESELSEDAFADYFVWHVSPRPGVSVPGLEKVAGPLLLEEANKVAFDTFCTWNALRSCPRLFTSWAEDCFEYPFDEFRPGALHLVTGRAGELAIMFNPDDGTNTSWRLMMVLEGELGGDIMARLAEMNSDRRSA